MIIGSYHKTICMNLSIPATFIAASAALIEVVTIRVIVSGIIPINAHFTLHNDEVQITL